MKINLSPSCLKEISQSIKGKNNLDNIFWGGVFSDDYDNPQVEEIYPLKKLNSYNIEKIFSDQEISFDVLMVFENKKEELKDIKSFCQEMGMYYYSLNKVIGLNKTSTPINHPTSNIVEETISKAITPKKESTIPTKIEKLTASPKSQELHTAHLREIFLNPPEDFQKRSEQVKMIRTILDAFETPHHAFIEAATGTGKSLAYLLPSLLLTQQTGERVVISTHTKTLQTQLLQKDIPKALKMLGADVTVGLVKGKSNYLCLRRFFDFKSHITQKTGLFLQQENIDDMMHILEEWLTQTQSGDLDSISGDIKGIRGEINTQSELCTKKRCPFYKDCFYYKLWNQLEQSKIIIVNHSLLVAQMEMNFQEIDHELIPAFKYLVLDEAHHFPKTSLRENSFSSFHFLNLINRLVSSKETNKKGLINHLGQIVKNMDIHFEFTSFLDKVDQIEDSINDLKQKVQLFFDILPKILSGQEYYRITQGLQEQLLVYQDIWQELSESSLLFLSHIEDLKKDMNAFADDFKEGHSILYQQIDQSKNQLLGGIKLWDKLIQSLEPQTALWIEQKGNYYELFFVNLDNELFLETSLWQAYSSVILTSATLSINQSLEDIKSKLYFSGESQDLILPPIFNYRKNSLFLSITDLPIPTDNEFNTRSCDFMINIIPNIKGGVLILATSIEQMNITAQIIENAKLKRPILLQGTDSMESLLQQAKDKKNAILIGVDSFWEGIDLPGEALELVILTKIPFKPPGHPITDVLSEIEKQAGNNPFNTITLSEATMKFKQGFGRLLRTPTDKGVIICLDHRITTKYYGKSIQASLYSNIVAVKQKDAIQKIQDFFAE